KSVRNEIGMPGRLRVGISGRLHRNTQFKRQGNRFAGIWQRKSANISMAKDIVTIGQTNLVRPGTQQCSPSASSRSAWPALCS
ncbi:hypothetical protein, partial [Bradyrhizobium sp. CCBAU 65884]|uniref:hypothetical protein n=1 Tax=Bradyrhizobium sp. CCBAU 65884 TaxID=722477 RepID=UPI0023058EDC